jgi:TolB protein
MHADGTGVTRVTSDSADDYQPSWSPDGSRIVFVSNAGGQAHVYMMNPNGSGQTRVSVHGGELPEWALIP